MQSLQGRTDTPDGQSEIFAHVYAEIKRYAGRSIYSLYGAEQIHRTVNLKYLLTHMHRSTVSLAFYMQSFLGRTDTPDGHSEIFAHVHAEMKPYAGRSIGSLHGTEQDGQAEIVAHACTEIKSRSAMMHRYERERTKERELKREN